MRRWSREELEEAFDHYQETALQAATSGDWRPWAELFTEDATYFEHHFGKFCGREAIYNWISTIMKPYPMNEMIYFPISWYSIDEDRGWVFCEVMNRMKDPGDGSLHEAPNITILHYAGNHQWKYEEDAYDWHNIAAMIRNWQKVKNRIQAKQAKDKSRHLDGLQQIGAK